MMVRDELLEPPAAPHDDLSIDLVKETAQYTPYNAQNDHWNKLFQPIVVLNTADIKDDQATLARQSTSPVLAPSNSCPHNYCNYGRGKECPPQKRTTPPAKRNKDRDQ